VSEWIAAGSADAPDGEIREVSAVALIRAGGRWYAYDDECPHAECPLSADAEVDGTTLVCNCHGSEFDLETGAVLLGPADDPLRPRVVRVVDGRLEVMRPS
jgi:nitrite reductase/ring-hydroxylating ferredoxin subunit